MWLWGDPSFHRPALSKLVGQVFKRIFEDQFYGAFQQRLVIPEILADLQRIVRFLEFCTSQTGLGRSDSPLAEPTISPKLGLRLLIAEEKR